MTTPIIRTERRLLRRARETDLNALHEIMADADTMHFWSTPPQADVAVTREGHTDHLTAGVDPAKARSLSLLAPTGFKETGCAARTWLVKDKWCDSVYLRLDRIPLPAIASPKVTCAV